ncbi:unnamed protein product [Aspergillus oryzae]|uniref:Unnamed protein product n=2 Tax=Aspergillus oryzae TaxID=5062 RepID=A0AAN5C1I7_ASPOZ|nr:unnamed protein product [Aspergillus oryzae]GMF95388.1 unnamed protein product [Aspergillus oryzae]GMG11373.1 unnamed protein product [Aspergillus oryzae]GMG35863.1 unnamed protein product [Aspergillus oryzae]GMG48659.1 unnamed protein product [Aspergillus oryzae var. brunneus]
MSSTRNWPIFNLAKTLRMTINAARATATQIPFWRVGPPLGSLAPMTLRPERDLDGEGVLQGVYLLTGPIQGRHGGGTTVSVILDLALPGSWSGTYNWL